MRYVNDVSMTRNYVENQVKNEYFVLMLTIVVSTVKIFQISRLLQVTYLFFFKPLDHSMLYLILPYGILELNIIHALLHFIQGWQKSWFF